MTDPLPQLIGQFGLSTISGFAGWWVNLGQALIRDSSRFTHAFVIVSSEHVVEARPGGAKLTPLTHYTTGSKAAETVISTLELTPVQQNRIAQEALKLVGVPYSFADYLSLALDHLGFRPKWLRKRIKDSGRLICSQLVDLCMLRAGIHLFDDGRDPGDISPGDLADFLIRRHHSIPVPLRATETKEKS